MLSGTSLSGAATLSPTVQVAYSRTAISPTPNDHTVILPTALLESRLHLMTYCHFAYSPTGILPTAPNSHTVILPTSILVSRLHLMTYCHFAYSPTGISPTPNSHTVILPTAILVFNLHQFALSICNGLSRPCSF